MVKTWTYGKDMPLWWRLAPLVYTCTYGIDLYLWYILAHFVLTCPHDIVSLLLNYKLTRGLNVFRIFSSASSWKQQNKNGRMSGKQETAWTRNDTPTMSLGQFWGIYFLIIYFSKNTALFLICASLLWRTVKKTIQ